MPSEYKATAPERADIEKGRNGYLLGFVEFDDQGAYWNRSQAVGAKDSQKNLVQRLEEGIGPEKAMLMIVFVHGWKNNASFDNGNVQTFREVLNTFQDIENTGASPRRVVGVYVGWRGLSSQGWPLTELSFWDRKNTAEKVGHGAVTDLLRQIEAMHERRHRSEHLEDRLVIVGHSFGGAVVFSALSQILVDRFVEANATMKPPRTFGDLVVLINPAFEAQRYDTLHKLDSARGRMPHPYDTQLPVMAVLTSESDWATKGAFPVGRWFSTFFELHRPDEDQKAKNRRAVGHYDPFKTHRLTVGEGEPVEQAEQREVYGQRAPEDVQAMIQEIGRATKRWIGRKGGAPCEQWKERFGRTLLVRKCDGATVPVNSPYLVVEVDRRIMNGHNDIANPMLIEFLQEFVLFASHRSH